MTYTRQKPWWLAALACSAACFVSAEALSQTYPPDPNPGLCREDNPDKFGSECVPVLIHAWQYYTPGLLAAPPIGPGDPHFPSEEEALAFARATLLDRHDYCTFQFTGFERDSPSFSTIGYPVFNGPYGWGHADKAFYETTGPTGTSSPCSEENDYGMMLVRTREFSCPAGFTDEFFPLTHQSGETEPYCYRPWRRANLEKSLGRCDTNSRRVGNPIDCNTGNKFQEERDYIGEGAHPLHFVRYYNSALGYHYAKGFVAAPPPSPLGIGWSATYFQRIEYWETANAQVARAHRPDGRVLSFRRVSGAWVGDPDATEKVAELTDGQGVRTGWQYTTSDDQVEIYDASGRLTSVASRNGATHTLTRDSEGNLERVENSFGHRLLFAWDASNPRKLATVTDPGNGTITYGYDSNDNLTSATYQDNKVRTYHYLSLSGGRPNMLAGVTDESNVRYSTYGYQGDGLATSTELAGGVQRYSVAYTGGFISLTAPPSVTITDPRNNQVGYGFATVASRNRVASVAAPCAECGSVAAAAYDGNGNLASTVDFKGVESRSAYDPSRNLVTSRTDAYGTPGARTTTTTWHPIFRLPDVITEADRANDYDYDAYGNVTRRRVLADGQTRTWTYQYFNQGHLGQLQSIDGPRTDVLDLTSYAYYACATGAQCGRVHAVTNAAGHVWTYDVYNAHGLPLTITDPNGIVTSLTYDARQRVTSRTVAGETTTIEYWPTGLIRRVTGPDLSFVEYTYDGAHRLTRIDDSEGSYIVYTLDAMGNRTAESTHDPAGTLSRTLGRSYDTLNRLQRMLGAANQETVHSYDENGNLDAITDPRNRTTSFDYDALNRLERITDAGLGLTQFTYDVHDSIVSVSDPRSLLTTYSRNGFGDLTQLASPDTGITQFVPDSAGNADLTTDARNRTGDAAYDALNRLIGLDYSDQTVALEYDQGANALGQLTRVTDASGSTQWTYNSQGRVAGKQQSIGGVTRSVAYGYNSAGQLTQVTTPSGQMIAYGYTNGRITSVSVNAAALLSQVLYEPFGPTRGWTWANGSLTVREYDTDWRLVTVDSAGLSTFTYFPDGLIQTRTDDVASSFTLPTGSTAYTLDAVSNRLSTSTGTQNRTYLYDSAGNTTSDSTRTFAYNDAGRMVSAASSGVTTVFAVNGLGQRVRKANASRTRLFAYDEAGHLIGEYDQSGTLVQEFVWLDEIPVAVLRPGIGGGLSVSYIHTDHLNTPRRISRPSDNQIVWRWDSDPFGQALPNEDPDGDSQAFEFNLRFPGQYFDSETSLGYNYFRDYDPAIGRYVESDPIGLRGGINTYGYAEANPVNRSDPLGLWPWPLWRSACGSGWNENLVPDSFRGGLVDFSGACRKHDNCYSKCGANRGDCDRNLERDMKAECMRTYMAGNLHFGLAQCYGRAETYGRAVSNFGQGAFERAQRECKCTP